MNPVVKEKWLAALRSGEYKQGRGGMKYIENVGGGTSYCCLGVICDIYIKENGFEWNNSRRLIGYSSFNGCSGSLPNEVAKWAGLPDIGDPVIVPYFYDGDVESMTCIDANDAERMNFSEIADLIEAAL